MKKKSSSGFTLIEVLLVIAILAILAAVVIVAINPAKQFGESQNAQRRSDVRAISDAVQQYTIDHQGALPSGDIPVNATCENGAANICESQVSCNGVNLDELIEGDAYLTEIPRDPTASVDQLSGYLIYKNENGRIGVCAPNVYGDAVINIVQ